MSLLHKWPLALANHNHFVIYKYIEIIITQNERKFYKQSVHRSRYLATLFQNRNIFEKYLLGSSGVMVRMLTSFSWEQQDSSVMQFFRSVWRSVLRGLQSNMLYIVGGVRRAKWTSCFKLDVVGPKFNAETVKSELCVQLDNRE